MTTTTLIDQSNVLKLLSSMYLCKPSIEAISGWRTLLAEEPMDDLAELKNALDKLDMACEMTLEELLWDYTRLFIGPYKLPCPPWESVYTSHQRLMMQEAANAAQLAYAKLGLTLDDANVMADHIGSELNFLALALEGANAESEAIGMSFLHEHLLKWTPAFMRDMEQAADTDVYRALARTTKSVLDRLVAR